MQNKYDSIFEEAENFILPEPGFYDFFEYLAGEKLELPEEKMPYSDCRFKINLSSTSSKPKKEDDN